MTKLSYIHILFFLFVINSFSQNLDAKKLDLYFQNLEANNKFMGSVAILKDGRIIYTNQTGFTNIKTGEKPNNKTKYRIGSISKTFTATLILKAEEEDKLSLNQTLDVFFPSIKNAKKITISNLLNHRSGIHNFTNDTDYYSYMTGSKSEKEMVTLITKKGSDFEPNTQAQYSNSNYVLLSYILEKIYNNTYANLLKEKITNPFNLKDTHFDTNIDLKDNECNSYTFLGKWIKQPVTHSSIPMGAGAITSTPTDLVLFSDALFSNKIISTNSVNKMKTIQEGYGMGIFQIPFYNKTAFGHTGGIDGFRSSFGYFQKENCAFAFIANGENYNSNKIAIAILSSLFNKPYDIPEFNSVKYSSSDLDQYVGVYSDKSFPLKITISKVKNTLIAQATGQPKLVLEPIKKNIFTYETASLSLEFTPKLNQMILKQGVGTYNLTKE